MNDFTNKVTDAMARLHQPCSRCGQFLQRSVIPISAVVFGIIFGMQFLFPSGDLVKRGNSFFEYLLELMFLSAILAAWKAFLIGLFVKLLGRFIEEVLPTAIPLACIIVPLIGLFIVLRLLIG